MNLCHAIIIQEDKSLSHELMEMHEAENLPQEVMLLPPKCFGDNRFTFAVLRGQQLDLGTSLFFKNNLMVSLSVSIVDDYEKKPLFEGQSAARSIFLLGELGQSLIEGLLTIGMTAPRIKTNPKENKVNIGFIIPSSSQSHTVIAAFFCFIVLLDSLFFERGLKVSSLDVAIISDDTGLESFLKIIKEILPRALS